MIGSLGCKGKSDGSSTTVTRQVKELCCNLVEDPKYQASFKRRLLSGELSPALESLVWHYAFGKPKDEVDLATQGPIEITWLK